MALKVIDADVGVNSGANQGVFAIVGAIQADVTPTTKYDKPPFVVDKNTGEIQGERPKKL